MQITEIWPERGAGSNVVARFNAQLSDDLKLVGLKLHQKHDGTYRVRPPNRAGAAAFHIGPDLARSLTDAAVAALAGGRTPHDFSRN
jgi:hypothetical protein